MEKQKPVGKTKDVGFQVGARKTFPVSIHKAWDFLFSKEGLTLWLGNIKVESIKIKEPFTTADGIEGKFTVIKPYSHLRMKWKPANWQNNSTLQIRIIPSKDKAIISFHQEYLLDMEQREKMKIWWKKTLSEFTKYLS